MRKKLLFYKPELKELAREYRNNPTKAEALLWKHLKSKQILGYDFHRQKPALGFILDFYCPKLMLAIEVDGEIHNKQKERDTERQNRLQEVGITFLRFTNEEIFSETDKVIEQIKYHIIAEIQKTQRISK